MSRSNIQIRKRVLLPNFLNKHGLIGEGVEVGVYDGDFSKVILSVWEGKLLYSVDSWEMQYPFPGFWQQKAPEESPPRKVRKFRRQITAEMVEKGQTFGDLLYERTTQKLAPFGERSEIVRATSEEAASRFEDESLDFVYIDADHDFKAVSQDLAVWVPKVKVGGLLSGHDFNPGRKSGVRRAVMRLAKRMDWSYHLSREQARSWFMWKGEQKVSPVVEKS